MTSPDDSLDGFLPRLPDAAAVLDDEPGDERVHPSTGLVASRMAAAALRALDVVHATAVLIEQGETKAMTRAMDGAMDALEVAALAPRVMRLLRATGVPARHPSDTLVEMDGVRWHVLTFEDAGDETAIIVLESDANGRSSSMPVALLTPRQALIARMVANGATTPEVANLLGLSVATVRRHLEAVHTRLGVKRRAHLVHFFVRP